MPINQSLLISHNLGVSIQIIGGRHFVRQGKGAVTSMFVDIEIVGAESDCCKMKTTTIRKLLVTVTQLYDTVYIIEFLW